MAKLCDITQWQSRGAEGGRAVEDTSENIRTQHLFYN